MSTLLKLGCFLVASAGLVACNSTSSANSTISTTGATTSPETVPEVDETEANFSSAMSILVRNTGAGTVVSSDRQDVSVTTDVNSKGDVIVELTALGRTVTFEPSDLDVAGNQFAKTLPDGTRVFLWTYDGTWSEVQRGDGKFTYMARFGTSDVVGDVNTRGYGVLGVQTTAAQLPTSGSARYIAEDGMRADVYPANDPSGRLSMYADVDLNMDFATSQISGEFKNIEYGDGSTEPAILKINPATVTNGSFATTMAIEGAASGETLSASSVNGSFYGDAAQEVGGDLSFTTTSAGGSAVGAGVFGASKQ